MVQHLYLIIISACIFSLNENITVIPYLLSPNLCLFFLLKFFPDLHPPFPQRKSLWKVFIECNVWFSLLQLFPDGLQCAVVMHSRFSNGEEINGSKTGFSKQEPCKYLRNYNTSFLLIKSLGIASNLEIPNSQWLHPCLQPKQLFHGKRATAHAGIQTAGTPHWNLLPKNPAINIWKNWSKCFYFYHTIFSEL